MTCRLERCTKINGYFNSHPHEEDDDRLIPVCYLRDISTHILTKRMTIYSDTPLGLAIISTHILTKRMTEQEWRCAKEQYFNSHPHEEDDGELYGTVEHFIFQLTSSRRGWQNGIKIQLGMIKFQLTSSRRGWQSPPSRSFMITVFQLTSSRRGWRCGCTQINQKAYFNSHPHEEDDFPSLKNHCHIIISTHILTKRMTQIRKRMSLQSHFNSHPHEEDDYNYVDNTTIYIISTHILTKRMTNDNLQGKITILFQLTSSRRGWRNVSVSGRSLALYFNSHPHEEDDYSQMDTRIEQRYFNSHPHEEDDILQVWYRRKLNISTHILTKRMTENSNKYKP